MAAITFDPTVSLGSIIAGLTVVVGLAAAAWRGNIRFDRAVIKVEAMEARLIKVEQTTDLIAVMQQRLMDGKERMDSLERRLERMEATRGRSSS